MSAENAEQVIVVGGGVAGCAAAIEAARQGLRVTLVDEHPQSLATMSLDVPYFYGTRLSPVLSDSSAVADRVLGGNDLLLECLDANVNVLTGTCIWGSYRAGPNSTSASAPCLGLADADRSWILSYEYLILAPGARDLVLSFPGWQLPGVLGAAGANTLLSRYQAFSGTRMVVLGSGNAGLLLAKRALEAGIEIAAIVEVAPHVRGDERIAEELKSAGIRVLTSHVIQEALGDQEVAGVRLRRVDDGFRPIDSATVEIPCDTVCMAYGMVPNIEMAAITGCALEFRAPLGGWIPSLNERMRTSVPSVYVVGDGAGVTERMLLDPSLAADQGRVAARTIASHIRQGVFDQDGPPPSRESVEICGDQGLAPAQEWLKAQVAASGLDVVLCQCEEATRRDLLDVCPPKYLGTSPAGDTKLSEAGKTSQDVHKRLTRIGMGHCQGRRCREHGALLLAHAAGTDVCGIAPGSYRPPVRPLPLSIIASGNEPEEIRRNWPIWFHPLNEGEIG